MSTLGRPPRLRRADRRSTPRRSALLAIMADTDAFLSASELHGIVQKRLDLEGLHVGLSTIYRLLADLARTEEIDVIRDDNGESLYRLPRASDHHHYLVCRSCGRAIEIVAEPVERWASDLGTSNGYSDITHTIELYGLCQRCHSAGQ